MSTASTILDECINISEAFFLPLFLYTILEYFCSKNTFRDKSWTVALLPSSEPPSKVMLHLEKKQGTKDVSPGLNSPPNMSISASSLLLLSIPFSKTSFSETKRKKCGWSVVSYSALPMQIKEYDGS
jgi:hypothetical protein